MSTESQDNLDAYLGYFRSGEPMEDVRFKNNGNWMRICQPLDDDDDGEEEEEDKYDIIFDQVNQKDLTELLTFITLRV